MLGGLIYSPVVNSYKCIFFDVGLCQKYESWLAVDRVIATKRLTFLAHAVYYKSRFIAIWLQ